MNNKIDNIGEKIKRERLRAGMTQTALAGDRISRNMLSMIENGEAAPSLETLNHIANTLDIPAGIFFSDSDKTDALYDKIEAITRAKRQYESGMYAECADTCRGIPFDDETSLLLAEALLHLANEDMKRFMLRSAAGRLAAARDAAAATIYASGEIFGTITCHETFISFASDGIDADALSRLSKLPSRIPPSYITFLSVLYYLEKGDVATAENIVSALPYLDPDHMRYLRAKKLSREFKTSAALEILIPLFDSEKLGFLEKYAILADIETCCENRRDFEAAYKYSAMKHHMLECFSK